VVKVTAYENMLDPRGVRSMRTLWVMAAAAAFWLPACRSEAQTRATSAGSVRATAAVVADSAAPAASAAPAHWKKFATGFVASILFHESAHIASAIALGAHPTFGFDKMRPTVYSGLDLQTDPHGQFIFSAAGLTAQTLLDELLLDIPHGVAGPFERGVLAGGLGTTLFYLTIGRTGYVSDIEFMARVHGMTKTQSTLLFGGILATQMLRIHKGSRYPRLFVQPAADGRTLIGVRTAPNEPDP
jgi:hypothetical protein